jgi:hypothetical protein
LLIDLHCHTHRYSACSYLSPEALVRRALELGLDGIAITEHGWCWSAQEVEELLGDCGQPHLVVLRGQEITTTTEEGSFHGDLLVFGLEEPWDGPRETRAALEAIHAAGAIAIAAHPYRQDYGYSDDVLELDVDGLEILNSNYSLPDQQRAKAAQQAMGVAALGGSDAHSEARVGAFLTQFATAIGSEEELIQAVRARRCQAVSYDEARGP